MRRFFIAFLALIAFAVSSFAQAKHPFTFEDMMKLKRVGDPQVSPDGKWVIFSVVDVDLEANTKTPHIWIVPTAGGQEKEIIADQDADRPRWSPDGKRFAFLSTKEGGSQVWVAYFDGVAGTVSEVHRLTSIATEAGGELWSPDGKRILFTSDVYPECGGAPEMEIACDAKKLKEVEQSKVKALIFDRLLYRHWNAYKEGKRTHLFVIPIHPQFGLAGADSSPVAEKLIPRDLTPGDYDAPVFSLGGQDDYAFSPDGQEICYTSNHDKNPAASTNNDLWIVPVNAGANCGSGRLARSGFSTAKNITADNPASDSTPLYSPDGRYIAYRAQQRPGYESDRFRLMLYDRKTGEKKNLTESFDHWVGYVCVGDRFEVLVFRGRKRRLGHRFVRLRSISPLMAIPTIRSRTLNVDSQATSRYPRRRLLFSRIRSLLRRTLAFSKVARYCSRRTCRLRARGRFIRQLVARILTFGEPRHAFQRSVYCRKSPCPRSNPSGSPARMATKSKAFSSSPRTSTPPRNIPSSSSSTAGRRAPGETTGATAGIPNSSPRQRLRRAAATSSS